MENTLQIALTIIGIIAASIASYIVGRFVSEYQALKIRVAKLEQLPKRLSHVQAAGLEDAMAVIARKQREIDDAELRAKQELERAFAAAKRDDRVYQIIRELRSDPSAYDMDRPNGR